MAELPEALTAAEADLRADGRRWAWWVTAAVCYWFAWDWLTAADWAQAGLAFFAATLAGTHPYFQRELFLAGFAEGWHDRPSAE